MKTKMELGTLLFAVLAVLSISSCAHKELVKGPCSCKDVSPTMIDLSIAAEHIRLYGQWASTVPDSTRCASGMVPLGAYYAGTAANGFSSHDIHKIVGTDATDWGGSTTSYFRAYTGLTDTSRAARLYIVPLDGKNQDSIPECINSNGETIQFVYDLTAPCPQTCDPASPLYRAFVDGLVYGPCPRVLPAN